MDNKYDNIASTSSIPIPIPRHSGDDEIMELLWQNIAPVAANPSSNSINSFSISGVTVPPSPPPLSLSALASNNQFYMAEDQMASWLHNPNSLVLPSLMVAASCPMGSMVVTSSTPMPISTVRESLETEEVGQEESNTSTSSCSANNNLATIAAAATNDAEKCVTTAICEMVDRKKKSREVEESLIATPTATTRAINTHTKEVEVQPKSCDEKKQVQGSCSSKRTRTAEEHNLSERRRRSRINENLKALQEIIPGCNKTDKSSMLEDAIEYLKSLKMQAQALSMGYGMMFSGIQQPYMPPPMGMGMYMGLGMDLGMTRPVVTYAPVMPPPPSLPSLPATNIVSPLASRTAVIPYVVPLVLSAQHSEDQPSIPANSSESSYGVPTPEMTPNMVSSCQQYLTYMQMQMQMQAAQMFSQSGSSKPDASKSAGDNGNNDDTQ